GWFVGVAFAAIAIGALVPAAIMSIACANLFTRNIYREYIDSDCSPRREAQVAKIVSLVVKLGALFFIIGLPTEYAIQFQLLGGILIIQTAPAVLLGLYTNKLNPWALLMGWMAGIGSGGWMAWENAFKVSIYPLHILGIIVPCYAAVSSLILNLLVSFAFSWLFNAVLRTPPSDATAEADYA
ncbi:MAG: sodium:solute symporter, partial [Rhizomicrobium sp.]